MNVLKVMRGDFSNPWGSRLIILVGLKESILRAGPPPSPPPSPPPGIQGNPEGNTRDEHFKKASHRNWSRFRAWKRGGGYFVHEIS